MSTPVIAFFNNKGSVGKTSLVYHLSWMYADRGLRVLTADLDPQGNLTSAFLDDDRLDTLFTRERRPETIFGCLQPLKRGIGDVALPKLEQINDRLALIVGDMALSTFEDQLSEAWPKCMDRDERAFRVTSAFWRILQDGAQDHQADMVLIDLGPNLGAINRAALIACNFVVIPLGPDLFSLQGLRNLGPALRTWRGEWQERMQKNPAADLSLPPGSIQPVGYLVLRHSIRLDRPVAAFNRWIARIPEVYQECVLDHPGEAASSVETDPNCITRLKDYRSLMPLAQEARKPMFFLKPADGALGAHGNAVKSAYSDFLTVARTIAERTHIKTP
ncbi:MAG TPA: AAA family ATPase [Phycisphaerae bacterium]|nr:AAA family ATPase [Phycisphaerae bacterium]HNU45784.1 AAA family ATPase [Phycisphaerae bacterium]